MVNQKDDTYMEIVGYFGAYDKNNDGLLNFDEFSELIRSSYRHITDAEIKEGFEKIDTDQDGQIDISEFTRWWGELDL